MYSFFFFHSVHFSGNLCADFVSFGGCFSQHDTTYKLRQDASEQLRFKGLAEGPSTGGLAMLGFKLMTF